MRFPRRTRRRALPWLILIAGVGCLRPAAADEKTDALFKQAREATAAGATLKADLELSVSGRPPVTGSLILKRPNLARIEVQGEALIVADGKTVTVYRPGS